MRNELSIQETSKKLDQLRINYRLGNDELAKKQLTELKTLHAINGTAFNPLNLGKILDRIQKDLNIPLDATDLRTKLVETNNKLDAMISQMERTRDETVETYKGIIAQLNALKDPEYQK
jgi:hypothetical protein